MAMEKANSRTADDESLSSDQAGQFRRWSRSPDCSGVIENLAVDVLQGTKFIKYCIKGIFS